MNTASDHTLASSSQHSSPSLQRSKRFATIALVIAVLAWLALMLTTKLLPEYTWLIHILMLSAEAGVVGGLADWYAITVLFRNPFGKMPIPKFLRDHTEIIPRNKDRIAESMGRFVQENFLSPTVCNGVATRRSTTWPVKCCVRFWKMTFIRMCCNAV